MFLATNWWWMAFSENSPVSHFPQWLHNSFVRFFHISSTASAVVHSHSSLCRKVLLCAFRKHIFSILRRGIVLNCSHRREVPNFVECECERIHSHCSKYYQMHLRYEIRDDLQLRHPSENIWTKNKCVVTCKGAPPLHYAVTLIKCYLRISPTVVASLW